VEAAVSRRNFLRGAGSIIGGASVTAMGPTTHATDLVKLRLLGPRVAQEITHLFVARLTDLNNKVIAELAVDLAKWQPHRTMPFIEELLKKQKRAPEKCGQERDRELMNTKFFILRGHPVSRSPRQTCLSREAWHQTVVTP
jgi:hypothetical protein